MLDINELRKVRNETFQLWWEWAGPRPMTDEEWQAQLEYFEWREPDDLLSYA